MPLRPSRRFFLGSTLAAALRPRATAGEGKTPVALYRGSDRYLSVLGALHAIDDTITPRLARAKRILIKPNLVWEVPLAVTHTDTLQAILDYLAPRTRLPIAIGEASAMDTTQLFQSFAYSKLGVDLIDFSQEGHYETLYLPDGDFHIVPMRVAQRLMDPDTFVISVAIPKTHNAVVATLSIKNIVLGAPLHQKRGEKEWSDKRIFHGNVRQMNVAMMMAAERLRYNWGLAVIDGWAGMEGDGPVSGTAVPSRCAIASTDFLAADRVGLAIMDIDPLRVGYLKHLARAGAGEYDLSNIELRGGSIDECKLSYRLHPDLDKQLQWMGPMLALPPKLG